MNELIADCLDEFLKTPFARKLASSYNIQPQEAMSYIFLNLIKKNPDSAKNPKGWVFYFSQFYLRNYLRKNQNIKL